MTLQARGVLETFGIFREMKTVSFPFFSSSVHVLALCITVMFSRIQELKIYLIDAKMFILLRICWMRVQNFFLKGLSASSDSCRIMVVDSIFSYNGSS